MKQSFIMSNSNCSHATKSLAYKVASLISALFSQNDMNINVEYLTYLYEDHTKMWKVMEVLRL